MRLKSKAEKQEERAVKTPARYSRKFARAQWRKNLGDLFILRKKIGPSFPLFKSKFK